MNRSFACTMATLVCIGSASPTIAANYADTLAQARAYYATRNYGAAYALVRTYRQTKPGTFQMDDLLAISACALPNRRSLGLALLQTLPIAYAPLSAANKSRVSSQITICSLPAVEARPIPLAMLGAGSGSTSIPLPHQLLSAGADSKSDNPRQRAERSKLLQRSQTLQGAITKMPIMAPDRNIERR